MARSIGLSQGAVTIVDDDDFERLIQWQWQAQWNAHTGSFYAKRDLPTENGKRVSHSMAREILGLKRGDLRQADHIDHDTLNNRKKNLRVVTPRGNSENRRDQSKYGVGIYKKGKRFCARTQVDGRNFYLGIHDTPEEASAARRRFLGRTLINLLLIPVGFAIGFSICTCVSTITPLKHANNPKGFCIKCDAAKEETGCCDRKGNPWNKQTKTP